MCKFLSASLLLTLMTLGCGSQEAGPEIHEVTGTVKYDSKPLPHALVTFAPIGETSGVGGNGRTDESGQFQVKYARGSEGLPEGTYKVAVSVRQFADGSPAPPGDQENPIESQARETMPPKYSDIEKSNLEVTVKKGEPVVLNLEK